MLEKFRTAKEAEINHLKKLELQNNFPSPYAKSRPSFVHTLQNFGPGAIIAEYKPASPSKGIINTSLSVIEATNIFKTGGAAAISVLTEEKYFCSHLDLLFQINTTELPLLRKDFIFHPLQIKQTASTPASALLLIVRMFRHEPGKLKELLQYTYKLNIEAVVEVFDLEDLRIAQELKAPIIQVNNRDLNTLKVCLDASRELISHKRSNEIWISASGITTPEEVQEMVNRGYDACLIGTFLMQNSDPLHSLQSLVSIKRK